MRVTTNSLYNNYLDNLGDSAQAVQDARDTVETGRRYTRVEQDPGSYALENRTMRELSDNLAYQKTANEAEETLQNQDKAMQSLIDMAKDVSKKYSLQALNGTSAAQRDIFANQLDNLQQSMVMLLNTNENGNFFFAGADGGATPFELDNGRLYYRGRDVENGNLKEGLDKAKYTKTLDQLNDEHLYYDLGFGLDMKPDTKSAPGDGDTGKFDVKPSSAFDMSLSGLKAIGWADDYTVHYTYDSIHKQDTATPVDKGENIVTLTGKLSKMLRDYGTNTDRYEENITDENGILMTKDSNGALKQLQDADGHKIYEKDIAINKDGYIINRKTKQVYIKDSTTNPPTPLKKQDIATQEKDWDKAFSEVLKKFDAAYSRVLSTETNIGVRMNFVSNTKDRLEMSNDILIDHYDKLVHVKPEKAIMDFSYAQTVFDTALRLGQSIMPKSLADFIR